MIDEEVETVLREIRARVISQPLAEPSSSGSSPGGANGNPNSQLAPATEPSTRSSEALARLNAHLTTTARSWDRLPPVFSNRNGTAARFEVWIKARLKVFSRWFTWEQVNFNAAVHHALSETLKTLTNQDEAIVKLADTQAKIQRQCDEIDAEINSLRAELQAETAARKIDLQNQERETNVLRAELRGGMEAVRIQSDDQGNELRSKIETAATDAAAQLANLANELRVCSTQLSLEMNETAVSSDRAQQRVHALLEEMDQRIKQLPDPEKR